MPITYADLFSGQIVEVGTERYRLKYTLGSQCALSELGVDTNDPKTMGDPDTIAKLIWAGLRPKEREERTWKDVAESIDLNKFNELVNEAVKMIKEAFIEATPVESDGGSKKKLN